MASETADSDLRSENRWFMNTDLFYKQFNLPVIIGKLGVSVNQLKPVESAGQGTGPTKKIR